MRHERQKEKTKITDAILMHKKEEAKQSKFIGQQTKNRANHNMMQANHEAKMKMEIQR